MEIVVMAQPAFQILLLGNDPQMSEMLSSLLSEDGVALSFTRLQDILDLTPGNLITHLRKLEDAGYLTSKETDNGTASRTSIGLTGRGRAALEAYRDALRGLLGGL